MSYSVFILGGLPPGADQPPVFPGPALSKMAIVGIVAGSVAFLVLSLAAWSYFRSRSNAASADEEPADDLARDRAARAEERLAAAAIGLQVHLLAEHDAAGREPRRDPPQPANKPAPTLASLPAASEPAGSPLQVITVCCVRCLASTFSCAERRRRR